MDSEYLLECAVGAQRQVDKGIEVDLDCRLLRAGICHWSGTTTFFIATTICWMQARGHSL
jgi:hypothetical protein